MVKDKITFLTKKNFDTELLIKNLKNYSKSIKSNEDQDILNKIIILLEKKDFSLLIKTVPRVDFV